MQRPLTLRLSSSPSHITAARWLPVVGASALLLAMTACADDTYDDSFDDVEGLAEPTAGAANEIEAPDTGMTPRLNPLPNRNLRPLNKPIQEALDNLVCASGPDMDSVHNYDTGNHIQSFVYTGPFSDGTARAWSTRSDADGEWEGKELFRNKFSASEVRSDGTMNTGSDIGFQESTDISGEDHAAQIDWLPDYGSADEYEAGYLFVAAENSKDVRIYYYHKDNGGDPVQVTTSSTRLSRQDNGGIYQVYITLRNGRYWLVMGEKGNFEVWWAEPSELFPSGAGSLDPTAFEYHSEHSPAEGGGANCYFVEDSNLDLYRVCYYNGSNTNCNGGNNWIYATKVTITPNHLFSIDDEISASVNLDFWGNSAWNCVSSCLGLRQPSFRFSGSHYVDEEGDLNVYSLAGGGQEGLCVSSGSSDGNVKACEE